MSENIINQNFDGERLQNRYHIFLVKTSNHKKLQKSLTMHVKLSCYSAFKTLLKTYFLFLKLSKYIIKKYIYDII